MIVPKVYWEFWDRWPSEQGQLLDLYYRRQQSFVPSLLPEQAVQFSTLQTVQILRRRLGNAFNVAVDEVFCDPSNLPRTLPEVIQSPVINEPNTNWLKLVNMVGINVRTIHSFWNIVKYVLTIPASQAAIHILPIWEPGVVGSLYGMSSWQINDEFFSPELVEIFPYLNTVEKQLKAVINILHAMGKAVGMDVIPHTDRYSEMALAFPSHFEWLQRQDTVIVDHRENLHEEIQGRIMEFLVQSGPAVPEEPLPENIFELDEARRLRILFGHPRDRQGRLNRRNQLIRHLYRYGYEPVPGTMAPPYRGLTVDTREEAEIRDEHGMVWRDYSITEPELMSRVFGPLARYKLYGRLDDNREWKIDFDRPLHDVWLYVCEHYYDVQRRYGFDFMRGDMSHVQMRANGIPDEIDPYYDLLGAVKNYIRFDMGVPYFGYFAETFLAPRDIFTYGEEMDHLEASDADTTLGDLQSTVVGSPEFMQRFRQYYDYRMTRACVPNFTVMTADKDDPRFDEFYVKGNEVRMFIAFFLADMPSYMGMGFTVRDVHYKPAPNEHYTKLYVFQETVGPKATSGPYRWGQNGYLYHNITRLRLYADEIWDVIRNRPTLWLLHPDPTSANKVIAWTQQDYADYLFVANLDIETPARSFAIPRIPNMVPEVPILFEFSTARTVLNADLTLTFNGRHYRVQQLAPGEGRVYRFG